MHMESENANHSTVYQNSTIEKKYSETASHKQKKGKKKMRVVSKTNPVHSPVIYVAKRPEPAKKSK